MADGLIKLSASQTDPSAAKGSDFKVAVPKAGMAEGANKLVNAPDSPGDAKPSDFKVAQSPKEGTALSIPCSVDLESGQVSPNVAKGY